MGFRSVINNARRQSFPSNENIQPKLKEVEINRHFYLQTLCEALTTLPHLVNLDLHGNLITASGISKLAETLRAENVTGLKVKPFICF